LLLDEGRARFLNLAPGVPLGVAGPRPEPITIHFSPGSTLVAFTDGLIEQRGQSLDEGLQRLGAAAAAESSARPDELIARLIAALTSNDQEDDIAILAVRFSPQEGTPDIPDASRSTTPTTEPVT
jgi:serine phosphatase RsbU (regulator of sigma subunit)